MTPNTFYKNVGQNITLARKARNLTQEELERSLAFDSLPKRISKAKGSVSDEF